jgi:hypothetical protein
MSRKRYCYHERGMDGDTCVSVALANSNGQIHSTPSLAQESNSRSSNPTIDRSIGLDWIRSETPKPALESVTQLLSYSVLSALLTDECVDTFHFIFVGLQHTDADVDCKLSSVFLNCHHLGHLLTQRWNLTLPRQLVL